MRQLFSPLNHGIVHCTANQIEAARPTPELRPKEWTVHHIAGIAEQGLTHETCDLGQIKQLPLTETRDATGEWIAAAASNAAPASYLLFTDVHGYGTLFYSFLPGCGVVFAETFQGVVGALDRLKVPRTINWTTYLTALTTRDHHFEGAFNSQSLASEVRLLGREQALLVTPKEASLIPRKALGGSLVEEDFSTALDAGINHATALLERVSRQGMLNTLHLSGGVDSRLCLALAAAAGVTDRYRVRTADPRTWPHPATREGIVKDVRIANELRTRLGMQWAPSYPHARIAVSFRESLTLKQTYRSSFLYSLAGSNTMSMAHQTVAAVRGGGGELLRATHGGQRLDRDFKEAREQNRALEPAVWRARRVSRSSAAIPDLIRHIRSAAKTSYKGISAESALPGFERHYLNYRNRSHFGHARTSLQGNELPIHVLSNPWLLRAAQLTPVPSRLQGTVVSELFRRTAPELLDLPFESDIWTARLTDKVSAVPESSWEASFDATDNAKRSYFLEGYAHGERHAASSFDVKRETKRLILDNFRTLEEVAPIELQSALVEQHAELLIALEAKRFPTAKVLAATSFATDTVTASRVSVLAVELGDANAVHTPWAGNAARVGNPCSIWAYDRT